MEDRVSVAQSNGKFLAVFVWAVGLGVIALGARRWLPPLASEHGAGIDRMIHFTMWAAGGMLMLGHAILGYFIWRFAKAPKVAFRQASYRTERRWSLAVAILMAVVAEGGVMAIGLPVWDTVFGSSAPGNAITIEVTTEQFGWNVRYAGRDGAFGRTDLKLISLDNPLGTDSTDAAGKDDIIDLNVIHVPVNQPVKIRLRSKDVLHSFFLPNFRVKQDSVPGMTIDLWFVPNKVGEFELACAELCGMGHSDMRGLFIVMTPEEFRKWFEERSNG